MFIDRVYITGPITGIADGNRPAFDAAAAWLRDYTPFTVISPIEEDTPEEFAATMADHYGQVYWSRLAEDFKMVRSVDALVLLPGWERSKGARLEVFVALSTGKRFFNWQKPQCAPLEEISRASVRETLKSNMP